MIKVKLEGDSEKIKEFLSNLTKDNFYYMNADDSGNSETNTYYFSESPGKIPYEEDFIFRGLIAQWVRQGLTSSLKDLLYHSDKGVMISFRDMNELNRIYNFIKANFADDNKISHMLDRISENNIQNFEKSGLIVYGQDPDFDFEDEAENDL